MNAEAEEPIATDQMDSQEHQLGRVFCFVSAKGRTGKPVLAATTADLLLKSGNRFVTIDADFSTRGLSLYLRGRILESRDLDIRKEKCLSDAMLEGMAVSSIYPRVSCDASRCTMI